MAARGKKTESEVALEDVGEYTSPSLLRAMAGEQVEFPIPEQEQQADS